MIFLFISDILYSASSKFFKSKIDSLPYQSEVETDYSDISDICRRFGESDDSAPLKK